MPPTSHKQAVLAALRARLAADLDAITTSQHKTAAGATHEEARPEGDKDTRATESSYLARGLARRVAELREAVTRVAALRLRDFDEDAPVALTALVELEDESGQIAHYFVAPAGGGLKLEIGPSIVGVVTPRSPLGTALVGKRIDDEVAFRTPQGIRALTIVALI